MLRGGALGDFILTLPTISALAKKFPQAELTVVAQPTFLPLAKLAMPSAQLRSLEDPELAPFFAPGAEATSRWRNFFAKQNLIVSYLHDPNAIFRARVTSCGAEEFWQGPSKLDESGPHAAEQLARPLTAAGISVDQFDFGFRGRSPDKAVTVTLHPGSGSKRKNWPIAGWLEFADELLARGESITVVGGEADNEEIARFRAQFPQINYQVNESLIQLVGLFANTTFLGHDSGVSHLAAMVGARCLLLFGPTNPAVWAPRGAEVNVLRAKTNSAADLSLTEVRAAYELMRIGIKT